MQALHVPVIFLCMHEILKAVTMKLSYSYTAKLSSTMSQIPISLQINCSYARVAIKELTPTNRSELDLSVQATKFQELFSISSYELPELLFQPDVRHRVPFDRKCEKEVASFNEAIGIPVHFLH